MTEVPAPLKAIVGLVAATLDRLPEARDLPERAVELPVLAVSAVLQASLRAQQLYAELTARGDEAISQLRGAPDEPPPWARFDDAPEHDSPLAAAAQGLLDEDDDEASHDAFAAAAGSSPDAGKGQPGNGYAGGNGHLRGPSAFDLADDRTDTAQTDTAQTDSTQSDTAQTDTTQTDTAGSGHDAGSAAAGGQWPDA